jgi:hypothetical protein
MGVCVRIHFVVLLSLLFFFLINVELGARTPASGNVQGDAINAINQVLRTQQAAWNRHELEGFMVGY